MKPPFSLVVFSGLDGAGKSTQIDLLCKRLRSAGAATAVVWVRGGYTPAFVALKSLVRRLAGRALPPPGANPARTEALARGWLRRLWLTIAVLDLALLLGVRVRILRRRGRVVVCDRYLLDSLIDFYLNFPADRVQRWWLWAIVERLAPRPDAAFLMLVPVTESERRSDVKREPFRDSTETLAARLALYQTAGSPSAYVILDGCKPADEVAATIATVLGLALLEANAYQPAA